MVLSKQSASSTNYVVQDGTLTIRVSGAGGTGSIEVLAGAGLVLDGASGSVSLTNSLILNGAGPAGSGALASIAGNNTVSGSVMLDSSSLMSVATGTSLTLAGGLNESASGRSLTYAGTGTLALAGTGTYSGGTTIQSGILAIQADNAAGTGLIDVQFGGSLKLESGSQISNQIVVAGTGVGGNGAIQASGTGNVLAGAIQLVGNTTIGLLTPSTSLFVDGVISEAAAGKGLSVSGPDGSEVILTAVNTYTGVTSISGAALVLGDGNLNGSVASSSIVLSNNGGLAVNRTDGPATPYDLQAVISGDGGFAVYGGNVLLSGANTYTGETQVFAGTSLVVGSTGTIASSSLINVLGNLEFQQTGVVSLAGQLEGNAPGVIQFGAGGSYTVQKDGDFAGLIQVDSATTLTMNGDIPATVNLDGILNGTGTIGQILAAPGSTLKPGVTGAGVLTTTTLSFTGTGSDFVVGVRDDGSNLVSSTLALSGGSEVDLKDTELVIQSTLPLTSVGTVLYLMDFTGGGSVQSGTYFTNAQGAQIGQGDAVQIASGLSGTLLYNFGPDGNDVVLLIAQNYSTFTYNAAAGTLELELGQDTNLNAFDGSGSDVFQLIQAAATQVIWVQFGGDAAPSGSTPSQLVIQPGLSGDVTIRQRSGVATGTNQVSFTGLSLPGGLTVSLDQGAVNGIQVGTGGLTVGGNLALETTQGSISQTGDLKAGLMADLVAGQDILLARAGNDFGGNVNATAAGKLQLADSGNLSTGTLQAVTVGLVSTGNLILGNTTATDLTLQSGGAISQTVGTQISSSGLMTMVASGVAGLGNTGNNFANVAVQQAGDLVLVDQNTFTLTEASKLTGDLDLEAASGDLVVSVPGSSIVATGTILLATQNANRVVVSGNNGLSLASATGDVVIDSGLLEVQGKTLSVVGAGSILLPRTTLQNSSGSASIRIEGSNAELSGDLVATGSAGASFEVQANPIVIGSGLTLEANDSSQAGNESILLDGDVTTMVATPDLQLNARQIQITGMVGSVGAPLGDLVLNGGTQLGGAIVLDGSLVLNDVASTTPNVFQGSIQAAALGVTSSVSPLVFSGLVDLEGAATFSAISSQGVQFAAKLRAASLTFNSSSGPYPVTLLGGADISGAKTAALFSNGGVTRLGDGGTDRFHFAGGLVQNGATAAIQAVGTILTNGTPVSLVRLTVDGLPLAIDTTGGSSAPAAITIQGPGQVAPGLTLKGSTNTFNGNSILSAGSVNSPTGTLQIGAGSSGFMLGGAEPGTGYTQFRTSGGVSLTDTKLVADLGNYAPLVGTVFTLVENTGSSAVSGTFLGLPEGATFLAGGKSFVISYVGGAGGNDITLRVVRDVPVPDGPVVAQPFNLEPGSLVAGIGRGQVRIDWYQNDLPQSQVITPFPFYTGSVNLATVDRSGDGVADAVVAMVATGGAPSVVVIDAASGRVANSFYAFAPQFLGGGTVAGGVVNLNGAVTSVIAVGAGAGAEPSVSVFDAISGEFIQAFYAYAKQYIGGVAVAFTAPDAQQNSLIIAASSINSHVTLFDLNTAQQAVASFYAFSPSPVWQPISVAGGVFTGADNKPFQAIVVGAASGWPSSVAVFDIRGLAQKVFYAFNPAFQGGVRVGVGDVNRDGRLEVLAGSGPGSTGTLNVFDYNTLSLLDALFISDTTQGVTLGSNLTV